MKLYCANNWVNMMGNNGDNFNLTYAHNSKGQVLPCLQRCELQSETLLLTTAQYPSKQVSISLHFMASFICSKLVWTAVFVLKDCVSISYGKKATAHKISMQLTVGVFVPQRLLLHLAKACQNLQNSSESVRGQSKSDFLWNNLKTEFIAGDLQCDVRSKRDGHDCQQEFDQVPISSMFYDQLFCLQIPKA